MKHSQILLSPNIKELSLTILPKPKDMCMPTHLYHFSQEENIVSDTDCFSLTGGHR